MAFLSAWCACDGLVKIWIGSYVLTIQQIAFPLIFLGLFFF